eukprot:TRINITY_DN42941_c0_g1_i1.p1 TRINITY_DN42941_c0_g1~~TRINITY_DN42941_c0_g1_i1.p1  ORF type:complete len:325 (+),score=20.06 TRINITY_DN42941_c0_g1_i1:144-1118(+)
MWAYQRATPGTLPYSLALADTQLFAKPSSAPRMAIDDPEFMVCLSKLKARMDTLPLNPTPVAPRSPVPSDKGIDVSPTSTVPSQSFAPLQKTTPRDSRLVSVLEAQVKTLSQALAGLAVSALNWSAYVDDALRHELVSLVLSYCTPCSHLDAALGTLCKTLQSTKFPVQKSSQLPMQHREEFFLRRPAYSTPRQHQEPSFSAEVCHLPHNHGGSSSTRIESQSTTEGSPRMFGMAPGTSPRMHFSTCISLLHQPVQPERDRRIDRVAKVAVVDSSKPKVVQAHRRPSDACPPSPRQTPELRPPDRARLEAEQHYQQLRLLARRM